MNSRPVLCNMKKKYYLYNSINIDWCIKSKFIRKKWGDDFSQG